MFVSPGSVAAEDPKPEESKPVVWPELSKTAIPLNKKKTVWLDAKPKKVILKTQVVLEKGLLEMVCCLSGRKEHESILALDGKAADVHAGLVALGISPGEVAKVYPEYVPPKGPKLNLVVAVEGKDGKVKRTDVRKWIRSATRRYFATELKSLPKEIKLPKEPDLRYDEKFSELFYFGTMSEKDRQTCLALSSDKIFQKAVNAIFEKSQPKKMEAEWIFTGSTFDKDPETGKEYYMAEGGRFICVANFYEATIDIAEKSSAENGELVYEADPNLVPVLGTPVLLEISLKAEDKK